MSDLVKRKRLPNRRGHKVVEFTHNGFGYTAGAGRFEEADKVGTAIWAQARRPPPAGECRASITRNPVEQCSCVRVSVKGSQSIRAHDGCVRVPVMLGEKVN
jgi:hypothetical protein